MTWKKLKSKSTKLGEEIALVCFLRFFWILCVGIGGIVADNLNFRNDCKELLFKLSFDPICPQNALLTLKIRDTHSLNFYAA